MGAPQVSADEKAVAAALQHALDVGHLGQLELLGHLGPDLRRVAIDRLPAADHQVEGRQARADGLGEGVGGGEGVRGREPAVAQENGAVGAAAEGIPENVRRARRPHGEDRHAAALAVLEIQGQFEGQEIVGVEDRGQRVAVHRAVRVHRLAGDVRPVRHLFDQDHHREGHVASCVVRTGARGIANSNAGPGLLGLPCSPARGAGGLRRGGRQLYQ